MQKICDVLQQVENEIAKLDCNQYDFFFRGLEDISWGSVPTAFRKGLSKESTILNELIRNYPDRLGNAQAIDIIAMMQHYGSYSRMLDVTMNAMTALFFACGGWNEVYNKTAFEDNLKVDGAIRIYKIPKSDVKFVDSEIVALLSNIARLDDTKSRTFANFEWECERDQHGVWHKYENREDLLRENVKDVNKVVLVKSNLSNPRVRAQFGAFFLFGGLSGVEGLEHCSQQVILNAPIKKVATPLPDDYFLCDVRVPVSDKQEILSALDKYFHINFSTNCPEVHDLIPTLTR